MPVLPLMHPGPPAKPSAGGRLACSLPHFFKASLAYPPSLPPPAPPGAPPPACHLASHLILFILHVMLNAALIQWRASGSFYAWPCALHCSWQIYCSNPSPKSKHSRDKQPCHSVPLTLWQDLCVAQLNTCTGVARLVPSIYQGSHPNALTCTLKKLRVQCDAVLQVPLFLRKTVKSYAAVPGGGGAYTIAAQITIFGSNSEDVFIHESTHAFDGTFQLSDQQAYLQTLYADSCVPDEYAQNNNVECFAQDMVVFLYYLWNPSFFQNPCLGRQIGFVNMLNVPGVQSYKSSVGESCTLSLVTSCSSQLAWRHPVVTDCNIYLRH